MGIGFLIGSYVLLQNSLEIAELRMNHNELREKGGMWIGEALGMYSCKTSTWAGSCAKQARGRGHV